MSILLKISGTIVHGTIVIVMLFWRPHPESPLVFFVIAGLWGVGDAVWQTQINGKITICQNKTKQNMHEKLVLLPSESVHLIKTFVRRNKNNILY